MPRVIQSTPNPFHANWVGQLASTTHVMIAHTTEALVLMAHGGCRNGREDWMFYFKNLMKMLSNEDGWTKGSCSCTTDIGAGCLVRGTSQ